MKKGNVTLNLIFVILVLTVFAVASFVGMLVSNELNDNIQSDSDVSVLAKQKSSEFNTAFPKMMDYGFMLIVVLFWGFLLVTSYMIDNSPVFFIFSLLLLVGAFFVGAAIQDFYTEFSTDPEMIGYTSSVPLTNFVMTHLMIVITVISTTTLLVLYAKVKNG
jgi:hypothetical protein